MCSVIKFGNLCCTSSNWDIVEIRKKEKDNKWNKINTKSVEIPRRPWQEIGMAHACVKETFDLTLDSTERLLAVNTCTD